MDAAWFMLVLCTLALHLVWYFQIEGRLSFGWDYICCSFCSDEHDCLELLMESPLLAVCSLIVEPLLVTVPFFIVLIMCYLQVKFIDPEFVRLLQRYSNDGAVVDATLVGRFNNNRTNLWVTYRVPNNKTETISKRIRLYSGGPSGSTIEQDALEEGHSIPVVLLPANELDVDKNTNTDASKLRTTHTRSGGVDKITRHKTSSNDTAVHLDREALTEPSSLLTHRRVGTGNDGPTQSAVDFLPCSAVSQAWLEAELSDRASKKRRGFLWMGVLYSYTIHRMLVPLVSSGDWIILLYELLCAVGLYTILRNRLCHGHMEEMNRMLYSGTMTPLEVSIEAGDNDSGE